MTKKTFIKEIERPQWWSMLYIAGIFFFVFVYTISDNIITQYISFMYMIYFIFYTHWYIEKNGWTKIVKKEIELEVKKP